MLRWLYCRLPCFVIFFITIGIIGVLALPFLLETVILPPILKKSPFTTAQPHIFRVTPTAVSGGLELMHQQVPVLSLPQFKLRYSPASLIGGKIDSLHLEQAVFHLYREGPRWKIPGLRDAAVEAKPASAANGIALPLHIDEITLERCLIILHDPQAQDIHVGVSGQINPVFDNDSPGQRFESISGSLSIYDDISATVSLFAEQQKDRILIRIGLSDGRWSIGDAILPEPLKMLEFETFSSDLDAILDGRSFSLIHYNVEGSLQGFRYTEPRFQISGAGPARQLNFSASGGPSGHQYGLESLAIDRPVMALLEVSGRADQTEQKLQTSGYIEATPAPDDQHNSVPLPVSLDYTGNWSTNEGFDLHAEGTLQPLKPTLMTEAGDTGAATTLSAESLSMALHLQSRNDHSLAELELQSKAPRLIGTGYEISTDNLRLHALLERTADAATTRIDGSMENLALAGQGISAHTIDFSLPLPTTGSDDARTETGAVRIDSVKLEEDYLFSLSTDIELQGDSYRAHGEIATPISPEATMTFTATAAPETGSAELLWKIPPAEFSSDSLPVFNKMLPGLDLNGQVEADGAVSFSAASLSAGMRLMIANGVAAIADKNITIEDIDCSIHLPELPRLTSSPSQQCSTGSIDISSLHFDNGEFTFRLEDSPALFIEKSMLQWCGGTLESGSLRLSEDMPEIQTTFFGSRINLGRLLDQFGFQGFEGEGSLNGRLPVIISNKRMVFDDGFLFSTPGTGGIVRFTNSDLLRQGIGGVSQAGTLNYALKALEDFSYNWTKLSFNTIDDELLLALELDGKPRTALPFRFDKNGLIIESDQGTGLQYPMRLDVNFRLPLAELFEVGQSINSIMGNDQ